MLVLTLPQGESDESWTPVTSATASAPPVFAFTDTDTGCEQPGEAAAAAQSQAPASSAPAAAKPAAPAELAPQPAQQPALPAAVPSNTPADSAASVSSPPTVTANVPVEALPTHHPVVAPAPELAPVPVEAKIAAPSENPAAAPRTTPPTLPAVQSTEALTLASNLSPMSAVPAAACDWMIQEAITAASPRAVDTVEDASSMHSSTMMDETVPVAGGVQAEVSDAAARTATSAGRVSVSSVAAFSESSSGFVGEQPDYPAVAGFETARFDPHSHVSITANRPLLSDDGHEIITSFTYAQLFENVEYWSKNMVESEGTA